MAKAKLNKNLMGSVGVRQLECPVCLNIMSAPIYQCQIGHSVCSSCARNLVPSKCPICRRPMTEMRNWQLEKLISQVTVACPNKTLGCITTMNIAALVDHQRECNFRDVTCPHGDVFGSCSWSGKIKKLMEHFEEKHPNNCYIKNDDDKKIHIENVSTTVDERYIYITSRGICLFLLTLKIDTCQQMGYWIVQHIGTQKSAENYVYVIKVQSNQNSNRNFIYSDNCYSDSNDINEIIRLGSCGIMHFKMLNHFLNNGKLSFALTVNILKENKDRIFPKGSKGPGQGSNANSNILDWRSECKKK